MKVAIIPARGGSKRIPRKNIKEFCGKPMIAYSIAAAQKAEIFDRIVVSTDDKEIADIATEYGAEIPFIRPAALADDYTNTLDVMSHAILELQGKGAIEYACCIYATAPFICAEDLKLAFDALQEGDIDYVFTATSYPFPIQRAIKLLAKNRVEMFQKEHLHSRSQDLIEAYHDAGQFYWGTEKAYLEQRPIFSKSSCAHILPRHRVQDIDTLEDWKRAELMYKALVSTREC